MYIKIVKIIIIIIIIINNNNNNNNNNNKKGRAVTAMLNIVLWNKQITIKKQITNI